MRDRIELYLTKALATLCADGTVPADISPMINVTRTRDAKHGDFTSNLAMMLAKPVGRQARDIAQALVDALPRSDVIRDVTIAGPGFINFFQVDDAQTLTVAVVLSQGRDFGRSQLGAGQRVTIELVSAHSRDPLHVDHARGAALGATIANLMDAVGFEVEREYFDLCFSEHSLSDDVQRVVDKLEALGHLYEEEGVRWFRSSYFGDDKNRVVVKANGQSTDFASDIACIDKQLEQNFDQVLYVLGTDCHGTSMRMSAACEALGHPRNKLSFLLVQPAILCQGKQRVQMSTGSGSFATIRELRDEVGRDAMRFFYVMRKHSQHLDFDLNLAKSQSNDNPVYYVQYAYARICSVMRQLEQRELLFDQVVGLNSLDRLTEIAEMELMTLLATYPEMLQRAALAHEPHQLTGYLRDLANGLHSYYNAHKVLVDDDELRHARLCLLLAVRQVLSNGLALLDVSAPEVM